MNMNFDSYNLARDRFDRVGVSEAYPDIFSRKWRHRRELRILDRAFSHLAAGSNVLDIPCGTGRLTRHLAEKGMHVTAADISQTMVSRAMDTMNSAKPGEQEHTVEYNTADILNTDYGNNHFDGVLCYRLLHHFHESELHRRCLSELNRISKGPVIVSIHTSWAIDYFVMLLRHLITGEKPMHRNYLPLKTFEKSIAAAGFEIVEKIPRMRFISPVWLYVLRRKT